jgi:hypothetical protein
MDSIIWPLSADMGGLHWGDEIWDSELSAYRLTSAVDEALNVSTGLWWPGINKREREGAIWLGVRGSFDKACSYAKEDGGCDVRLTK